MTLITVFAYDRRGRGNSSDTLPYTVEREVEDIDALITEAGGSAFVFGYSSGAVLALEAAHLLPTKMTKLAVYEPPFIFFKDAPASACVDIPGEAPRAAGSSSLERWHPRMGTNVCHRLHRTIASLGTLKPTR